MAEFSALYDIDEPAPRPRPRERSRSRSPSRRRSDRYGDTNGIATNGPKWGSAPSYRDDRGPSRYRDYDRDHDRGRSRQDDKAIEAAKRSRKECRIYVGNLAYSTRWTDLKDHFRSAGSIAFAEVMLTPEGRSRGCGVVEYSNEDEALRAIRDFNETNFQGRMIHVRHDRENEARFGMAAFAGGPTPPRRDDRRFGGHGGPSYARTDPSGNKRLSVRGLNESVGWQDLKDLFRQAGDIVRADVNLNHDNRCDGTGYVIFSNSSDARNACSMFDGAELNGMRLEVKEERFAAPTSGAFGASSRHDDGVVAPRQPSSMRVEPSKQILVKNLPYSTCNEDLIELFQTTGTVEHAEILYEGGRAKGSGVVQMISVDEAESSMDKFQGYVYGGRPLQIEFNPDWRDFSDVRPAVA